MCPFAKEGVTLWGLLFELGILGSSECTFSPPTLSAKDAERVGHPAFMCDSEVTWNGWATRQCPIATSINKTPLRRIAG